jgi:hypothetical protein
MIGVGFIMINKKVIMPSMLVFALFCFKYSNAGLHKSVEVAVINIKTETVATIPTDRNRKKLGVGERVVLTVEPTFLPNVKWSLNGEGILTGITNNPITFVAHERASQPIISVNISGVSFPVQFTVVEPTVETAIKDPNGPPEVVYPPGKQGAGMHLIITVHPTDVSFHNLELRELPGPAINVEGYFLKHPADGLHPHDPGQEWFQIGDDNETYDLAECQGYAPEWSEGFFQWSIPVRWRVIGSTNEESLLDRIQTFYMSGPDGTTTVSKIGQTVTRTP